MRDARFHAIASALRRILPFDPTAIFLHETRRNVLRLFVLDASMPSTYCGAGLELLRILEDRGVVVVNWSSFVTAHLRG